MKKINALIVVLVSLNSFNVEAADVAATKNCKLVSGFALYETHLKEDTKKCGTQLQDSIDVDWYLHTGTPKIEKFMKKGCGWTDLTGIHKVEELADICQSAPRHSAEIADPIVTIEETFSNDDMDRKWIVPPTEKGGMSFDVEKLEETINLAFRTCGNEVVACKPVFEKEVKEDRQTVIGNARIRFCMNAFKRLRKTWASDSSWTSGTYSVKEGGLKIFCNAPRSTPHVVPKDEAVATAAADPKAGTPTTGSVTHGDDVEMHEGPTRVRETPVNRAWNFGLLAGLSTSFSQTRGNTVPPYIGGEVGLAFANGWLFEHGMDFTVTLTYDRARRYPVWGIAPDYVGGKLSAMGGITHDFLIGLYVHAAIGKHSDFEGAVGTQAGIGLQVEYILVEGVVDLRVFLAGGLVSESSKGYAIRVRGVDYQVDATDTVVPEASLGLKVIPFAW